MTLRSTWSITSNDENAGESFLSGFDLSLSPRKLSMDPDESPMARSRATNERLFPKKEVLNSSLPMSPTDGVNKLSDWFESCTLDENQFKKNSLWSNCETNSLYKRPIISQTSPLFSQESTQLWSHIRFATSAIGNNFWTEQSDSQMVPSSSPITTSVVSSKKDESSSSSICFTFLIFMIGLVLGYFLTNTFPPNLLRHWFLILEQTSITIIVKYFHLCSNYLQMILQYLSSNMLLI